jgi:alginate O-acetyltransferase complex protein AlgI
VIFNSLDFAVYLLVVLVVYYRLPLRAQNVWLLVVSYFFYGYWDWRFCLLIAFSTLVDYVTALRMHRPGANKNRWLLVSVLSNLSILAFFKYFGFFVDSVQSALQALGWHVGRPALEVILPVGISFYTFQSIAYTVDVWRGELKPVRSLVDFALYVIFFPQLVAGPIERADRLIPQIEKPRTVNAERWASGLSLILHGLFMKIVIADNAAPFVQRCFAFPGIYSSLGLLIGVYLFALQIYADFSGYSNIARGVARLLGFELMVNFEQPYFATNITEFWRRWHISLSTWLRDYLYIPLGGNRRGARRTYVNLLLTMLLGGLWHGAAWTFVIWGALHGVFLALHKWYSSLRRPGVAAGSGTLLGKLAGGLLTFHLVCLAWIFFRAQSVDAAWDYLGALFSVQGPLLDRQNPGKVLEPGLVLALMSAAVIWLDWPVRRAGDHDVLQTRHWLMRGTAYSALAAAILLFGGEDEVAFIYFQF